MTYITVSGAYGRDYRSLKDGQADWAAGKDFVIRTLGCHTYMTKRDVRAGEVIMLRYAKDRKIGQLTP